MKHLAAFKAEIDHELARFLTDAAHTATVPVFKALIQNLATVAARGGKRLRPYLAYVSYTAYGGRNHQRILRIGTALELIHTFLLIHDDVIDEDTLRHGGPNLTGTYEKQIGRHQAESVAIIGGDLACLYADQLLLEANLAPETYLAVKRLLLDVTATTLAGELMDIAFTWPGGQPTSERVIAMYGLKTARYSITGPFQVGALLAGASLPELRRIERFTAPFGIAYQLHDDELGIFGDESKTGKSVLTDIRQGKQTPLYLLARQQASPSQKAVLNRYYGKANATHQGLEAIRKVFRETGALESVGKLRQDYQRVAQHALAELSIEARARSVVSVLMQSMSARHH